jgi:hypothetical protein
MRVYFWPGVFVIYFGFVALLWEVCVEPELIKRPPWVQVVGIGIIVALFDVFTIGIVAARAPIYFDSYAMRHGNHSDGTNIEGIVWDSHFTDLKVGITNMSVDGYDNLDVAIQPDRWTHKAAIVGSYAGCSVLPMGGDAVLAGMTGTGGATSITAHRSLEGVALDAQDNKGNLYTTLATEHGYRLRCDKFPPHFTIQIVFALVAVRQDAIGELFSKGVPPLPPGGWGLSTTEISGPKSSFDLLDTRPYPVAVHVDGNYERKLKPYKVEQTVKIEDGN